MISDINIRVNRDLCYACGICVDRCIMDNLSLSIAPCRQECPLHMNCQGYIRLIAMGKESEAAKELRKYTPFGAILGRICSRPCETACVRDRNFNDGAVHIRALKRYLADTYPDIATHPPAEIEPDSGHRAAIIGSGPAGLMAAYHLREKGHHVDVFEAQDRPGGFLRNAIPSFRLPSLEVDRAVDYLKAMGIVFKTGHTVGSRIPFEELEAYDAVLVAVGAAAGKELDVAYHQAAGIVSGLDVLAQTQQGVAPKFIGQAVVVIGGGNTAVDCALICQRSGAKNVTIVCLENPLEMPAYPQELREAVEAGIAIENCWGVSGVHQTGGGEINLSLARCLTVFDADGQFSPKLDDTCTLHELTADVVVLAIGQEVDPGRLPADLFNAETRRLSANPLTLRSPFRKNVFVCGDGLTGPSSVVHAMASGKEAAISADRFIKGASLGYGRDYYTQNGLVKDYEASTRERVGGPRGAVDRLPVSQRSISVETDRTMTQTQARREAERCLSCGRSFESNRTCWCCLPCEIECPVDALEVRMPYQVR